MEIQTTAPNYAKKEIVKSDKEITKPVKTVSMMAVQKSYIDNIGKGLETLIGNITPYQALCGYNVLNKINTLLATEGLTHKADKVNNDSVNDAIKFAMIYQLNTDNNEIFVIVRNKKNKAKDAYGNDIEKWEKIIECKPQYKGQLKIISNYGRNVKKVYPEWVVREGDDFTYATMKGVEVIPPTWTRKDQDGKIIRVVVPVEYNDGFIDYRIAERESIATNIKAQINQSLITEKEKDTVLKVKTLMKDMSLDQLLADSTLSPYINETYKGISSEEMIITKLVINATKRVPIDYKNAFSRELYEKTFDNADVYKKNHIATSLMENEKRQIETKAVEVDDDGEVEVQETSLADLMKD